jgi:chorismate dehydratase
LTKIKVGAVSYLNTKPLIYGFEKGMMSEDIELLINYPSKVASELISNEIDIGLVPVAIIPQLKEHYIISDYCIGAIGPVASVCLFSDVPLQNIKTIFLDYQSRTSVELLKILVKEHWKLNVEFKIAEEDYISRIKETTAGLIIGDRALEQRKNFAHIYDLAEEWKRFTQLPFVFAAWVSNKQLPDDFIDAFNKANRFGLENLNKVIENTPYSIYDLHKYYTKNISYILDSNKRKGMELFLEKLKG